jgi:hypothetical protein
MFIFSATVAHIQPRFDTRNICCRNMQAKFKFGRGRMSFGRIAHAVYLAYRMMNAGRSLYTGKLLFVMNSSRTFRLTFFKRIVFSSLELKAQVSYSDCRLSVVWPTVCKLLHFRLLLQNHWANFNQSWHRSSLELGVSSLFKWRGSPLSKGR